LILRRALFLFLRAPEDAEPEDEERSDEDEGDKDEGARRNAAVNPGLLGDGSLMVL
jgi:hypothetical protein